MRDQHLVHFARKANTLVETHPLIVRSVHQIHILLWEARRSRLASVTLVTQARRVLALLVQWANSRMFRDLRIVPCVVRAHTRTPLVRIQVQHAHSVQPAHLPYLVVMRCSIACVVQASQETRPFVLGVNWASSKPHTEGRRASLAPEANMQM